MDVLLCVFDPAVFSGPPSAAEPNSFPPLHPARCRAARGPPRMPRMDAHVQDRKHAPGRSASSRWVSPSAGAAAVIRVGARHTPVPMESANGCMSSSEYHRTHSRTCGEARVAVEVQRRVAHLPRRARLSEVNQAPCGHGTRPETAARNSGPKQRPERASRNSGPDTRPAHPGEPCPMARFGGVEQRAASRCDIAMRGQPSRVASREYRVSAGPDPSHPT